MFSLKSFKCNEESMDSFNFNFIPALLNYVSESSWNVHFFGGEISYNKRSIKYK